MKTIYSLLFLTGFCMGTESCTYNNCHTVLCLNGGTCNNGSCTCPPGYKGSICDTPIRDQFLGTWNAIQTGPNVQASQYVVAVSWNGNPSQIQFSNLLDYPSAVIVADLINADSFYIPSQLAGSQYLSGTGDMYAINGITTQYTIWLQLKNTANNVVSNDTITLAH